MRTKPTILHLQPISRELLDNVARPLRLMPTYNRIDKIFRYSFVPYHPHGRRASQELRFPSLPLLSEYNSCLPQDSDCILNAQ